MRDDWNAAIEAAARAGYVACAETRHVKLGDAVAAAIRALRRPAAELDAETVESRLFAALDDARDCLVACEITLRAHGHEESGADEDDAGRTILDDVASSLARARAAIAAYEAGRGE